MKGLCIAALLGYLLGSVPFGLILTRLRGLGDIRAIGSGNIGATNVLRTGHKWLALFTLFLDGAKGAAAVALLDFMTHGQEPFLLAAGAGAILGHLFPVWLKFKGGKGVATGLGVALALNLGLGIAMCLTWLAVAAMTRYSSLAALIAFLMGPVFAMKLADSATGAFLLAVALVIAIRHHANIRRLLNGTETRIGKKSVPSSA